jgi:hypothetical protein
MGRFQWPLTFLLAALGVQLILIGLAMVGVIGPVH